MVPSLGAAVSRGFLEQSTVILTALPLALIVLAWTLRHYKERLPAAWSGFASLLLVPGAFIIGSATAFEFMKAADLSPFRDFNVLAFYNGAPLALFVALFSDRLRALGYGLAIGLLTLTALGDLIYFRHFGNILPLLAVGSGGQIWDVRDIVAENLSRDDLWLFPPGLSAIAVPLLWPRKQTPSPLWFRLPMQLTLVAGCIALTLPMFNDTRQWMGSLRSWRVYNGMDSVRASGLIGAHVRESFRAVRELSASRAATPEELIEVRKYHETRAQEARASSGFGAARGMNILVIQVEALQSWVVGAQVKGQPITPFLDDLRSKSLYFPNLYDQTGESPTSDAEYLTLNGQHPLQQGAVAFRVADNDFVALPHLFAREGYGTLSAHAYMRGMWNRAVLHPRWGFEQAFFREELGDGPRYGWGISDKLFFERMLPILGREKEPWFAFLITLTSHAPYTYLPAKERTLESSALAGTQLGNYAQSMHYVDEALAQLFAGLREQKLLDHTMVVIYGDHDSRLTLKPKELHAATRALNLSPDMLSRYAKRDFATDRIPLFIVLPAKAAVLPSEVATFGGQIDTGATILHLAGLARPRSFLGRTLYPERPGLAVTVKGGAASPAALWVPARNACEKPDSYQPLPEAQCTEIRQKVTRELEMSWKLTMKNLAQDVAARGK